MRSSIGLVLLLAISSIGGLASAQPKQPPKEKDRYEFRAEHDPNGIGKFYLGREIAHVMGWQGAGWLERPEREREEAVSKLHPSLGVKAGETVADLGAGSGHHTIRLSKAVGDKGKVYAVDIQKEMINILKQRMIKEKIKNVEAVLCTEKDPKLPEKSVDLILMVDVYHELSYPYEVTRELVKSLKPGGRLVFVEYRLEDPKVRILEVHRMSINQVMKEMAPHKEMKHQKTLHHLPWQHVIFFEKLEAKKDEPAKEKAKSL